MQHCTQMARLSCVYNGKLRILRKLSCWNFLLQLVSPFFVDKTAAAFTVEALGWSKMDFYLKIGYPNLKRTKWANFIGSAVRSTTTYPTECAVNEGRQLQFSFSFRNSSVKQLKIAYLDDILSYLKLQELAFLWLHFWWDALKSQLKLELTGMRE